MEKDDFLRNIDSLSNKSSWDEVKKCLLFDLKSLSKIDNKKVKDFKEKNNTKVSFKYVDSENEGVKNFWRYSVASKLKFYKDNFDCSNTQVLKEVLKKSFDGKIDYDNDCFIMDDANLKVGMANSFGTSLNDFMKYVLKYVEPNWVENYQKKYNLKKNNDTYRDLYFLENIDKWLKKFKEIDKALFEEFNTLGRLIHTVGNYVLLPSDYDYRHNDYFDLVLIDLKDQCFGGKYKWYNSNYGLLFMDNFFLKSPKEVLLSENEVDVLFGGHSLKHKNPKLLEMSACLNKMGVTILKRSISMLSFMNSTLDKNLIIHVVDERLEDNDLSIINQEIEVPYVEVEEVVNDTHEVNTEASVTNNLKNRDFSLRKISKIFSRLTSIVALLIAVVLFINFVKADGYSGYIITSDLPSNKYFGFWNLVALGIISYFSFLSVVGAFMEERSGGKRSAIAVLCGFHIFFSIIFVILNIILEYGKNHLVEINKFAMIDLIVLLALTVIMLLWIFTDRENRSCIKELFLNLIIAFLVIPLVLVVIQNLILTWILIILSVLILLYILVRGMNSKCPKCKKMFGLKFVNEELFDKEEVTVKKIVEERDGETGKVIRKREEFVPGVKFTYVRNYRCSHCDQDISKLRSITREIK